MKNPQIACSLCHTSFDISRTSALGLHMNEHIYDSPFECPDCADLFDDLGRYLKHLQNVHGEYYDVDDEQDSVADCDDDDVGNNNSIDYFSSDDEKPIINPIQKEEILIKYEVVHADEDVTPKCVECGKELPESKSDKRKGKIRTCTDCRQTFIQPSSDNTFKCEVCEKLYPSLLSLRLHRRLHSGS